MHGSNNDDVRRHNLSTILSIVHRNGATPRSQLTRMTGLNRSTVAALVAELVELGLAIEREPDATKQVGRPSPVVAVDPRVVAVAVNPEIDAVTIAVVGLGGHVHRRIRHVLEHSPSVSEAVAIAASVIAALRGELDAGFRVAGIGLAVPGQVRSSDGMVRLAPHLDWVDAPIASLLAEASGYPAFAANDAGLGAIAEW
ncbi:MAG TPA: ROK family protein, partial [Microterricola sp.]